MERTTTPHPPRTRRRLGPAVAVAVIAASTLVPTVAAHATGMGVAAGVVVTGNDGDCSLREAIVNANADAQTYADCPAGSGPDVITLPAGTYHVDDPVRVGADSVAAFQITSDITLVGAGSLVRIGGDPTTLDAHGARRHFHVHEGANLVLEDLRLENGSAIGSGGAILNEGHASTLRVHLVGNEATLAGGAVHNGPSGELDIATSALLQNRAQSGGAIRNEGVATIAATSLTNNVVEFTQLECPYCDPHRHGAAVFNVGELEIDHAKVGGNTVISGSEWSNLGAVYNGPSGHLVVASSTVDGNNAQGIVNHGGDADIEDSTISHNTGQRVGGIWNLMFGSTHSPDLVVYNSTISSNSAPPMDGDLGTGGIRSTGDWSALVLVNVTVTGNSSGHAQLYSTAYLSMANSIVAQPTAGHNCQLNVRSDDWYYRTNNLADDDSCVPLMYDDYGHGEPTPCWLFGPCAGNGFTQVAALLLGALDDNGGPTRTHLPHPASPAVDAGSQQVCNWELSRVGVEVTDQRGTGFPRTVGSACDIGAVELEPSRALDVLAIDVGDFRFQAGPAAGTEAVRTSLVKKLDAAIQSVDRGDYDAASGQLSAFGEEVTAHDGRWIAEADADRLVTGAQMIATLFPEGSNPPDDN